MYYISRATHIEAAVISIVHKSMDSEVRPPGCKLGSVICLLSDPGQIMCHLMSLFPHLSIVLIIIIPTL